MGKFTAAIAMAIALAAGALLSVDRAVAIGDAAEARMQFQKGRAKAIDAKRMSPNERDLVLADILLAQADLGTRDIAEVESGARLKLDDMQKEVRQTSQNLNTSEGRALALRAYDDANRPTNLWTRDTATEQMTLREQFQYGDSLQDQTDARNRNLRGKLYEQRDEADDGDDQAEDDGRSIAKPLRQPASRNRRQRFCAAHRSHQVGSRLPDRAGRRPSWGSLHCQHARQRSRRDSGDFDLGRFASNMFSMEWPPKSGRMQEFPEADRAGWFAPSVARRKVTKGQVAIVVALLVNRYLARMQRKHEDSLSAVNNVGLEQML